MAFKCPFVLDFCVSSRQASCAMHNGVIHFMIRIYGENKKKLAIINRVIGLDGLILIKIQHPCLIIVYGINPMTHWIIYLTQRSGLKCGSDEFVSQQFSECSWCLPCAFQDFCCKFFLGEARPRIFFIQSGCSTTKLCPSPTYIGHKKALLGFSIGSYELGNWFL